MSEHSISSKLYFEMRNRLIKEYSEEVIKNLKLKDRISELEFQLKNVSRAKGELENMVLKLSKEEK